MERGKLIAVLAALSFVSASSLAAAKDIRIGNYVYPSFILIPIISIVISFLILLGIILLVVNRIVKERVSKVIRKTKPLFTFGKQKVEARHENIYLKDIKKFKREMREMDTGKAFGLLSDITKSFFRDLLDLHYEFTYNELELELRKRKKRKELIDICRKFSELRYSGKRITKEELEAFVDEIEKLVRREAVMKEESEIKVSRILEKERKGFMGRLMQLESEKERKKHLLDLMSQEENALKKDMDIAKKIYHKILSSYYKLPSHERKEIYDKLTKFYEEVNKMLFSSFYSKQSKKQLEYFSQKLSELQKATEKAVKVKKIEEVKPIIKMPQKPVQREKAVESEELRRLDRIEKEAIERIKRINENIVEQSMLQPVAKEKIAFREIRPVMPAPIIVHKPVEIKHKMPSAPAPIAKPAKPKQQIKPAVEHVHVPKHIESAREIRKAGESKNRKFMHIEKEAEGIKEKLEKLKSRYIG